MTKVWSENSEMDVDDVWDDTELIKMYDESIQEVYKQIDTTISEKEYKSEDGTIYKWKVGGTCMAPFGNDGESNYYAATIDSIGGKDGLEVTVTFLYYGNQEVVHMKDLWINEEAAAEAIQHEKKGKNSRRNNSETGASSAQHSSNRTIPLPSFAPPVPPNIISMAPVDQREAMSSMLMSWYMSGYHTGYYQALADQERNSRK